MSRHNGQEVNAIKLAPMLKEQFVAESGKSAVHQIAKDLSRGAVKMGKPSLLMC